jgi:hypothetical protein
MLSASAYSTVALSVATQDGVLPLAVGRRFQLVKIVDETSSIFNFNLMLKYEGLM